jgi:hypothetical protein
MRANLAKSAVACDWSTLAKLIRQSGGAVRFTYGAAKDPIIYWQGAEKSGVALRPMRALRLILGTPYTKTTSAKGPVTFVWPSAFAFEHPTDAQLQAIARTGLYSMATLKGWTRSGVNYLGYRVFITAQGKWTEFVDGD